MSNILSSLKIRRSFISSSQIFKLNVFVLISLICFIFACINGSINIGISDFFTGEMSNLTKIVLIEIRLPRVILAALVGASLGISGAALRKALLPFFVLHEIQEYEQAVQEGGRWLGQVWFSFWFWVVVLYCGAGFVLGSGF